VSAALSHIRLDLNNPEFQDVLFRLQTTELRQVVASLRRLLELDWNTLYRHTGFHWEAIEHLKAPNGAKVDSLRLSQGIRALAFRDGEFLRFLSLHPDHCDPDCRSSVQETIRGVSRGRGMPLQNAREPTTDCRKGG
jgi:hypothetical protein